MNILTSAVRFQIYLCDMIQKNYTYATNCMEIFVRLNNSVDLVLMEYTPPYLGEPVFSAGVWLIYSTKSTAREAQTYSRGC